MVGVCCNDPVCSGGGIGRIHIKTPDRTYVHSPGNVQAGVVSIGTLRTRQPRNAKTHQTARLVGLVKRDRAADQTPVQLPPTVIMSVAARGLIVRTSIMPAASVVVRSMRPVSEL